MGVAQKICHSVVFLTSVEFGSRQGEKAMTVFCLITRVHFELRFLLPTLANAHMNQFVEMCMTYVRHATYVIYPEMVLPQVKDTPGEAIFDHQNKFCLEETLLLVFATFVSGICFTQSVHN